MSKFIKGSKSRDQVSAASNAQDTRGEWACDDGTISL